VNALHMARMAYSSSAAPIRTPKGTEHELISRITRRLKAATEAGPARFADLAAALHDNRRLWITLAANVADSDNALPEMLRARIAYLAEFTLRHSGHVLDGSASSDVLIDINTAVMRGLRQQQAAA